MTPFLEQVAAHLHQHFSTKLENVVIVLPNRRASLFLKTHLAKYFDKTVWLPKIISSEEFVLEHANLQKIDNISLLFRFYEIHQKIEGDKAESFDEFMLWGQVLLQDFNEIDQYLIDSRDLFSFINDARALEVWNVDGSEITDTQRNYLEFWKKLPLYYKGLHDLLKSKNECYQGIAFRTVAENIKEIYTEHKFSEVEQFVFAGFNALNQSEEKIIDHLIREKKATLLWDADTYYLNDRSQEAGLFLRRFKKKWDFKEFNWVSDNWKTGTKNITITGVNGNVNQAQFVGDVLNNDTSGKNFQDTAVVLADEMLLDPVLQALPDNVEHVNVTMGYALENSPMHSMWLALVKLHENALKYASGTKANTYHYKDVIQLLNHPFVKNKEVGKVVNHIIKFNWVFIESSKIIENVKGTSLEKLFIMFFTSWNDKPITAVEQLSNVAEYFREKWNNETARDLHQEYLHRYHKIIGNLSKIVSENKAVINNVKTIKQLFSQLMSKESVDFYGEPLKGLQLMGVLETRTLDFDKVILVSANEGTIPANKSAQSFIPFEIKRKFRLPTHIEKDALFAYHFYKLLQRASDIHLVYNTDVDGFSGSEKSRFITQILYEIPKVNKNIIITEQQLSFDLKADVVVANSIDKSPEIIEKLDVLFKKGISPSAINKYINCPLDFYYNYILKLREQEEVEEKIEASTMGTVIHEVLEDIYTPFLKKIITAKDLTEEIKTVEVRVDKKFKEFHFTSKELGFGKNYLTIKVVVKFVVDFIKNEIKFIEKLTKEGQYLTILELEKELETSIKVNGLEVRFKGIADRVDKIGNTVRIIDYKTGLVEPKQLTVKDMDQLTTDAGYSKALQLMLYGMMFVENNEYDCENVVPGIISFRKLSEGLMSLNIEKNAFSKEQVEDFKPYLQAVVASMIDVNNSFEHNNTALYCNFCDI